MRAEPLRTLGQESRAGSSLPQPARGPHPFPWPPGWHAHAKDKGADHDRAPDYEQHGSRIIAALEHAWAAIQDQHPDVPMS